jgi:hypothetical protein
MREEQRKSTRRTTTDAGRVVYDSGEILPCRIRDISDLGARIELPDGRRLPPQFRLEIGPSPSRPVKLVWHTMRNAGVKFVDWGAPAQPKQGFGKRGIS